jgi:cytochrome P450
MIHDRANSYKDYSDLFSNLLAANENDSEGLKLTDEELTGNIFIFLLGN